MDRQEVLNTPYMAGMPTGYGRQQPAKRYDDERYAKENLKVTVSSVMHGIGIPANVKGYRYLREAVMIAVNDMDIMNAVTKELYPEISRKFGVTSTSVERAIRHAIGLAWNRGNPCELQKYFGYETCWSKYRPTNKHFIAMLADRIDLNRGCDVSTGSSIVLDDASILSSLPKIIKRNCNIT